MFDAGATTIGLDPRQLASAFAAAQTTLEFDAYARTYAGHRTMTVDGREIRLVPLRVGTKPIGLLAAAGRPVEAGTLDTLAGVVAIAIERAQFLEERKASELTRQSEELKTALLASLGPRPAHAADGHSRGRGQPADAPRSPKPSGASRASSSRRKSNG